MSAFTNVLPWVTRGFVMTLADRRTARDDLQNVMDRQSVACLVLAELLIQMLEVLFSAAGIDHKVDLIIGHLRGEAIQKRSADLYVLRAPGRFKIGWTHLSKLDRS